MRLVTRSDFAAVCGLTIIPANMKGLPLQENIKEKAVSPLPAPALSMNITEEAKSFHILMK